MKLDDCPSCSSYSKIQFMIATRTNFPITLVISVQLIVDLLQLRFRSFEEK